jgi:hypothetical protein
MDRNEQAPNQVGKAKGTLDPNPEGGRQAWSTEVEDSLFVSEEVVRRQAIAVRRAKIRIVTSIVVLIFGGLLARAMWSDAAYYFTQSDDSPVQVGALRDYLQEGKKIEDLRGLSVDLIATPDVRSVAKLVTKDKQDIVHEFGYIRLVEAGLDLLAATPKLPGGVSREYPGRFVGRVRPLEELGVYPFARDYFAGQQIRHSQELDATSIGTVGEGAKSSDGALVQWRADDRLEVVVRMPHLMVQLGKATWPTREAARAALESLGLIYAEVPELESATTAAKSRTEAGSSKAGNVFPYFAFVVEPPASGEDLAKKLNEGQSEHPSSGRLEDGATVIPVFRTYWLRPSNLTRVENGGLRLVPESKVVGPGWRREGNLLVEKAWEDGGFLVDPAQIEHLRLSRPLAVHPGTMVIQVGAKPSEAWQSAGLFAVLMLILAANVVSLFRGIRVLART